MSNLVSYHQYTEKEIKAVESLPVSSKPYITALMDTKLKDLKSVDFQKIVFDYLKLAEIDSGLTKIQPEDLLNLSSATKDLILDRYPHLTKAELKTAFKNGSIGLYGEWFGMCLKSINQWLKGYMENEARARAIKEWNDKVEKSEFTDKPLMAQQFFSKSACQKAFNWYKKNKEIPFAAFAYYDIINELNGVMVNGVKTLVTDREKAKKIYEEQKEMFTNQLMAEKEKQEKRGNYNMADGIMTAITADFKNINGLNNLVKAEFLKVYFDSIDELILPE